MEITDRMPLEVDCAVSGFGAGKKVARSKKIDWSTFWSDLGTAHVYGDITAQWERLEHFFIFKPFYIHR